MTIQLANAPVSYGAFELTVRGRYLPPAERVLDAVAAAGYAGIDLGPLGYLGTGAQLAERLAARRLGLAGAYLELPFADAAALEAAVPELDAVLDTFAAVDGRVPGPPPRPTLAAASSPAHRARPGQAHHDHSIGLDDEGWRRFADGLARVVERGRARGYEPAFHHHAATYCEAPWEIERVLELSDVGLCLDTGHLLVGGGDPLAALRQWAARIRQVHLKDASRTAMTEIITARAPADAIWSRGVFRPLGAGDVDLDGVLAGLREVGYSGWVVVEQDVIVSDDEGFGQAAADQRANRRYLAERGL